MTTTPQLAAELARAGDPLARAYHRALALRWLATVLAMPVLVPLLLARGLDLGQIALVMATFAAVTAALELPTGGLADAFGRVRVTLVADASTLVAQLAFMLAPGLPGLLAAAAIGGAARALGSGSLEAWYVDARRVREPHGDLRGPLARAGVVQSLVLALAMLAGGALPLLAPALGIADPGSVRALQLTYAASVALWVVSLAATSRLREARSTSLEAHRAARPDLVARIVVRTLRGDHSLGALVAFGATAAGQALAARQASAAGAAPLAGAVLGAALITLGSGLIALDVAVVATAAAVALVAAGSWSVYFGLGLATPSLAAAFHDRVPSAQRATMLSLRSLAAYAGGVLATLALGRLAEGAGLAPVWLAVAGLAAGAALTAARWRGAARTSTVRA